MKLNLKRNASRLIKYAAKRIRIAKRMIQVSTFADNNALTARLLWERKFTISNPKPKRSGVNARSVRIAKHRAQWNDTPVNTMRSRQARRNDLRRSLKDASTYQNRHFAGGRI